MKRKDEAQLIGITPEYWSAIRHKKIIPSLKLAERIEKVVDGYRVVDLIPNVRKIVKRSFRM
jgi:transcriptional regulator with XRE-family HTH domain